MAVKPIVMRFEEEGVPVNKFIVLGGISKKSTFVILTLANVLEIPIEVVKGEQTCALGAAMFTATITNIHPNIQGTQKAMSSGFDAYSHLNKKKYKYIDRFIENTWSWGKRNSGFSKYKKTNLK